MLFPLERTEVGAFVAVAMYGIAPYARCNGTAEKRAFWHKQTRREARKGKAQSQSYTAKDIPAPSVVE